MALPAQACAALRQAGLPLSLLLAPWLLSSFLVGTLAPPPGAADVALLLSAVLGPDLPVYLAVALLVQWEPVLCSAAAVGMLGAQWLACGFADDSCATGLATGQGGMPQPGDTNGLPVVIRRALALRDQHRRWVLPLLLDDF